MKLGKYMKIYENLALVEIVTAHKTGSRNSTQEVITVPRQLSLNSAVAQLRQLSLNSDSCH